MTIAGGLHYVVLFSAYAVLWFLCLFCLLPVGLGSERDPESGAPLNPQLKKKALIALVVAAVLWAVFYAVIGFGWVGLCPASPAGAGTCASLPPCRPGRRVLALSLSPRPTR